MQSTARSKTRERMEEILKYEKALGELKQKLIADCPHDHVEYWPDGSGGSYYDKAEYWYNLKCLDCLKQWSVPQDVYNLKKFKTATRVTRL